MTRGAEEIENARLEWRRRAARGGGRGEFWGRCVVGASGSVCLPILSDFRGRFVTGCRRFLVKKNPPLPARRLRFAVRAGRATSFHYLIRVKGKWLDGDLARLECEKTHSVERRGLPPKGSLLSVGAVSGVVSVERRSEMNESSASGLPKLWGQCLPVVLLVGSSRLEEHGEHFVQDYRPATGGEACPLFLVEVS